VYIDASNIKANVGRIDYKRLMQYLVNRYGSDSPGGLLKVKVFTPILVNARNTRDGFISLLKGIGYDVHVTDAFINAINTRYKDNSDMKIAVEVVDDLKDEMARRFVFMTGDRDFLFVIERIIHAGRSVEIFGPANATCSEYRLMQGFIEIEAIKGIKLDEEKVFTTYKDIGKALA
jgi:uncharacterized LabA/DUF88 family protein